MEVKLIVQNGKQAGLEIPVRKERFLIGRGEECQLRPQSNLISRKHCLIHIEEGGVTIEDCGSTNGTFLNDEKISERRELKDGDLLRVGMLILQVRLTPSLSAKWKPKVQSIQEAAARTVASANQKSEDVDLSTWLSDGEDAHSPPVTAPEEVAASDTVTGKSLVDTTTIVAPHGTPPNAPHQKEGAKKPLTLKDLGKSVQQDKKIAKSSGDAAAEILRQFFHRKKT